MHKRVRLAIVVAAIIMIMAAATVTTIAIVRPQIFYHVKEQADAWRYRFTQEDPNNLSDGFTYRYPKVPNGYKLYDSSEDEESIYLYYSNKKGELFTYQQDKYNDSLNTYITNTAVKKEVQVNGITADLYNEEGYYLILWNDGISIYMITWWNCTEDEIIEVAESVK